MTNKAKRAALYVRVSTDHQSNQNQITELTDYAARKGWQVVQTYSDEGISGTKGRNERSGLDQMLKDATRHKFDVVAVWALDRLGRSLPMIFQTVETLKDAGVGFYIQKFFGDDAVDTTSPQGELIFTIFAGIAKFERGQMLQRQKIGIKRARAQGVRFGRPKVDYTIEKRIRAALAKGDKGILKIASEQGVGSGTVQRIKAEMVS